MYKFINNCLVLFVNINLYDWSILKMMRCDKVVRKIVYDCLFDGGIIVLKFLYIFFCLKI